MHNKVNVWFLENSFYNKTRARARDHNTIDNLNHQKPTAVTNEYIGRVYLTRLQTKMALTMSFCLTLETCYK